MPPSLSPRNIQSVSSQGAARCKDLLPFKGSIWWYQQKRQQRLKSWEAAAGAAEICLFVGFIQSNPIQEMRAQGVTKKVNIYLKDPPRWHQQKLSPERQEQVLLEFASMLEISNPRDVVAKRCKQQGFAPLWMIHQVVSELRRGQFLRGRNRSCWYPTQCHLPLSANFGKELQLYKDLLPF